MSYRSNRRTYDFSDVEYSPEIIRQYEDPEFAKAALEYEKEAERRKRGKRFEYNDDSYDEYAQESYEDFEEMLEAEYGVEERAQARRKKRKKQYRLRKTALFRHVATLLILVFVFSSGAFFFMTKDIQTEDVDKAAFDITEEAGKSLSKYRNILILGSDARGDESIDGSRSDVVLILSINRFNSDIRLISVMRDTYLKMDYTEDQQILDKITHAHAYGGGVYTAAAINRSMDLNIDEYVVFNWKAVTDVVDCLGGIELDIQEDEIYDLNLYGYETAANTNGSYTPIEAPGKQVLDGVQATTYCRIRKNSGGDSGRAERHKKVISAVIKKALKHPGKLGEVTSLAAPNIRTNMKQRNMFSVALRAPFMDMKEGMTFPEDRWTGLLGGISYVVPSSLESNVQSLYEKAFGKEDYQVTSVCRDISDEIISDTGVY